MSHVLNVWILSFCECDGEEDMHLLGFCINPLQGHSDFAVGILNK